MIDVYREAPPNRIEPYITAFKTFAPMMAGKNPPWINQLRKSAIAHFAEIGFPTMQHEDWKYTNVAPLINLPFQPVTFSPATISSEEIRPFTFNNMRGNRLVFLNGKFSAELSAILEDEEVAMINLLEAMEIYPREIEKHLGNYASHGDNAFASLNAAFFQDGAFISLPAGKKFDAPIHLLFVTSAAESGTTAHPRTLILAGKRSKLTVIESYVTIGDSPCFTNPVTEIFLDKDAELEHCKVQMECRECFHIASIQARQNQGSRFMSHSISIGGRIARNDIKTLLAGEECSCVLNGLYLGKDEQLIDHHTLVDHAKPRCESHEFYHGVLDEHSHGVFNGKIVVQQDAQKTNARQTNRNLLLSDTATIDTKPQLEIFADDVKCTHGATVGQLDEQAIFYLRSRGIGAENARRMLIYAFVSDVVNRISIEPVRAELDKILAERFQSKTAIAA
jgi:Fe-S cluster assembly protein SufD